MYNFTEILFINPIKEYLADTELDGKFIIVNSNLIKLANPDIEIGYIEACMFIRKEYWNSEYFKLLSNCKEFIFTNLDYYEDALSLEDYEIFGIMYQYKSVLPEKTLKSFVYADLTQIESAKFSDDILTLEVGEKTWNDDTKEDSIAKFFNFNYSVPTLTEKYYNSDKQCRECSIKVYLNNWYKY